MSAGTPLSELLKQYRLAAGLTQQELAERASLSIQAIDAIERGLRGRRGRLHPSTVRLLCNALELDEVNRAAFRAAALHLHDLLLGPPFNLVALPKPEPFVGRESDLAWVLDQLSQPEATPISAVRGMGGIGKSMLVAVAARNVYGTSSFPDGIVAVQCRGRTDPIELLRLALAFFTPHTKVLDEANFAYLCAIASRLLKGKRTLIVLDNIEPDWPVTDLVQPLVEAGATLLLTARQQLPFSAVPLDACLKLELLPEPDALELFAQSCGRAETGVLSTEETAAISRIVTALARHTLAIKLAGLAIAEEAAGANEAKLESLLQIMAAELEADPRRALGLPEDDVDEAVKIAFEQSTGKLPVEAQRLFAALAAVSTGDCGRNVVLALAKASGLMRPEATLRLLERRALVDVTTDEIMPEASDRERVRLHPLVRALAQTLFIQWPEDLRDVVAKAAATYYAGYISHVPTMALGADELNVAGTLEWAHDHSEDELVMRLTAGMERWWFEHFRTAESLNYLPWGVEAAETIVLKTHERVDALRHAHLLLRYGDTLLNASKPTDAEPIFTRVLVTFRALADRRGEGQALGLLGNLAQFRGQLDEADTYLYPALQIAQDTQDRQQEAFILRLLALGARWRGQMAHAEDFFQQALQIAREVQDRDNEGTILSELGQIARRRGRLTQAEAYFHQAVQIADELQDHRMEGIYISYLGQVAVQGGRLTEAEDYYEQALQIAREVQDSKGEGMVLAYLGQVYLRSDRLDEAGGYCERALAILRELEARIGQAVCLGLLGQVALQSEQVPEAEQHLQDALAIRRDVGDRLGEAIDLRSLAQVAEARTDWGLAESYYTESLDIAKEIEANAFKADVLLDLGCLLIVERGKQTEGCGMLGEALHLYHDLGLPGETIAREAQERLNCVSAET